MKNDYPDYDNPAALEAEDPDLGALILWFCGAGGTAGACRADLGGRGLLSEYGVYVEEVERGFGRVRYKCRFPLFEANASSGRRNAPCPCGSGKKSKRCCCTDAAARGRWKLMSERYLEGRRRRHENRLAKMTPEERADLGRRQEEARLRKKNAAAAALAMAGAIGGVHEWNLGPFGALASSRGHFPAPPRPPKTINK